MSPGKNYTRRNKLKKEYLSIISSVKIYSSRLKDDVKYLIFIIKYTAV